MKYSIHKHLYDASPVVCVEPLLVFRYVTTLAIVSQIVKVHFRISVHINYSSSFFDILIISPVRLYVNYITNCLAVLNN